MGSVALATETGQFPSLLTITNSARVYLNDWQRGITATPGEGKITSDQLAPIGTPGTVNFYPGSPQTLPALTSSIRELYRELRNAGSPRLIRDNVQANLPANSVTGPNIQTYLARTGYWDGGVLQSTPTLPTDMLEPVELWEQQTTNLTSLPFVYMRQPQFGLYSRNQTFALGEWEWREGQINFVGCLAPVTIRMRYYAALAQFFPPQALITGLSSAGSVVTFTCANTFTVGQSVYLSGFVIATGLNGLTVQVQNPNLVSFQVTVPGIANVSDQGFALPVTNYSIVFANTFIPILDCEEAVAYKFAAKVAKALSGVVPSTTDLDQSAKDAMFQLRNAIARRSQSVDYHRVPYNGDATRDNDRNLM